MDLLLRFIKYDYGRPHGGKAKKTNQQGWGKLNPEDEIPAEIAAEIEAARLSAMSADSAGQGGSTIATGK